LVLSETESHHFIGTIIPFSSRSRGTLGEAVYRPGRRLGPRACGQNPPRGEPPQGRVLALGALIRIKGSKANHSDLAHDELHRATASISLSKTPQRRQRRGQNTCQPSRLARCVRATGRQRAPVLGKIPIAAPLVSYETAMKWYCWYLGLRPLFECGSIAKRSSQNPKLTRSMNA
jgi:hypothetical protein